MKWILNLPIFRIILNKNVKNVSCFGPTSACRRTIAGTAFLRNECREEDMIHSQIYDLDKKLLVGDSSAHSAVPVAMLPILNCPQYEPDAGEVSTVYRCLPSQRDCKPSGNCELVVLEQPADKFRFRYKSEMHGTHGSLNGDRSARTKKTFPEVELKNFYRSAVIRCSLYQTNIDKPSLHSHHLVVHKDDMDVCDPHDVFVSQEKGYIARFENMGIIHTAKKDIAKELINKKKARLRFEQLGKLQSATLSQKNEKALEEEAKREAKSMNLNQVRLCFEAFEIVNEGHWVKICEPVFSRPISNRKSALTGELKICRLSIIAGSAAGGDDLILLVEKVNKNNIKVRFYELVNDEEVWEAFGYFTEADVHHQYAIVVRTPAYRDKDIDNHVTVFIELVRESDNERSSPVKFRYKPRDIVLSRKRRRTNTNTSLNSYELPESVANGIPQQVQMLNQVPQTSNKDQLNAFSGMNSNEYQCHLNSFMQQVDSDSDELLKIIGRNFLPDDVDLKSLDLGLVIDGEASLSVQNRLTSYTRQYIKTQKKCSTIKQLISTFSGYSTTKSPEKIISKVQAIFEDYVANNDNGDTILHDIIRRGSYSDASIVLNILSKLNLIHLLSQTNSRRQTPLHVACMFDQPRFIRHLLALKCDPDVQDRNGNTALHIVIAENLKQCMESFVLHLSSCKLNVNLTNDLGLTPLHVAIRASNIDFVRTLLVKCNASVKIANSSDGNNALHLAVQQHNKEIIKIVLENSNVNVNTTNRAGHTAVDLAKTLAGKARAEILEILYAYLPSSADLLLPISGIKEEPKFEDTSSSGEEDDDKSSLMSVDVKEEICLQQLLKDEKICKQLEKMLNVDNKWKLLGQKLKLNHLFSMFTNAGDLLRHVVVVDMRVLTFLSALEVIDQEAAIMVKSILTS